MGARSHTDTHARTRIRLASRAASEAKTELSFRKKKTMQAVWKTSHSLSSSSLPKSFANFRSHLVRCLSLSLKQCSNLFFFGQEVVGFVCVCV